MKVTLQIKENTKAAEIEALHTLGKAFEGSGLYLEKLFSPGLIAWAAREITDDVFPDAIDRMDHFALSHLRAERESREKMEVAQAAWRDEMKRLHAIIDEKSAIIELKEFELREADKVNRLLAGRVNQLEQECEAAAWVAGMI